LLCYLSKLAVLTRTTMWRYLLLLVALVAAVKAQNSIDELIEAEGEFANEVEDTWNYDDEEEDDDEDYEETFDPCDGKNCGAGRSCVINDNGEGVCSCVTECEMETDPRRRVCSNYNETWMSDCSLHKQRCLCEDDLPGCQDDRYLHLQIDYFGQCQQQPECDSEELYDFPRRMREWLFTVMRDMAARQLLSSKYQALEKEGEADATQQWTNAVVWKWCDLDGHPQDRKVSRHELFPIRAPLHTLEHCITTFLDSCDPDGDHYVTLKEWASCLQLNQEHVEDLQDLCEDIRDPTPTMA